MTRHDLKIWPDFFGDVVSGAKKYEVRKNDRNFQEGDELHLREYNPDSKWFTGRTCIASVKHVTRASDLQRVLMVPLPLDFCVMGIEVIG